MLDIVVILSHCDNSRKLDKLDKCVSEIKKQGYPVIISSHINLPDKYFQENEYIIYDKENPIINNMDSNDAPLGPPHTWYSDDFYYHVTPTRYNYSFAVMKLMKSSAGVAYANGYKNIHFVNYDYILIDNSVLRKNSDLLSDYDIVGFHEQGYGDLKNINTGLFSVNTKKFIEFSNTINTKREYLSFGQPTLERFIYEYYHEKCGLSVENSREIGELKNICRINTEATFPGIVDGYNGKFHLYFTKEESTDTYYITNWVNLEISKKILLFVDDIIYSIDTLPFNQKNIIDVTNIVKIGKTIIVNVPDHKFIEKYNISSDTSFCNIHNRDIVKNIESYRTQKIKKQLILSIYDRDYSWINDLDKEINVVKYNKNINNYKEGEILIKNVGRDVHTFFKHILDNYYHLPDYLITSQDYPFDHCSNYVDIINGDKEVWNKHAIFKYDECWFFNTDYTSLVTSNEFGDFVTTNGILKAHPDPLPVKDIWGKLFKNSFPGVISFPAAGHFCISRDQIKKRTYDFYRKVVEILEEDSLSPWVIERFEHFIFAGIEKSIL